MPRPNAIANLLGCACLAGACATAYAAYLPTEYEGLEYIESTGSSYLDTGIVPTSTTKTYFDFMPTSTSGSTAFFAQEWNVSAYLLANLAGIFDWFGGGSKFASFVQDQRYQFTISEGTITLVTDGVQTAYPGMGMACKADKHLYVSGVPNNSYLCKQRIYEMKIWEDGTLVAHFVPCRLKDGSASPTLYNFVSRTPATTLGTGVFTAGPHDSRYEISETGVYDVTVTPKGRTSFSVEGTAVLLGDDAGAARKVSFAWGHSPDHFPYTNDIATVTGDGTVSADLSGRVLPGYTNYGKFLIETATGLSDGGDGVVSFQMPVTQTGNTLPEGYCSVSHIDSSGTQYLDTGVTASDDLAVDISFRTLDTVQAVIGSAYSMYSYLVDVTSGKFRSCGGGTWICSYAVDTDYRFILEKDSSSYRIGYSVNGGDLTYVSANSFGGSGNLAIFGANNGTYLSKMRLYSCKMTVSGVLTRDFVPCVRMSDGKAGLYDLVSDAFFGDANGGTFAAGTASAAAESHLTVVGAPAHAAADPDYGDYENLLAYDAFDCFAAPDEVGSDARTLCTGYSLYTNETDSSEWLLADSGAAKKLAYTHPTNTAAKLVWSYATDFRITVAAEAGGTAAFAAGGTEKWCASNAVSEIVATPAAGYSFAYWTGNVPAAQACDNPLSLRVTAGGAVTAHFVKGTVAVWLGGAGDLASEASNWKGGAVPQGGDTILLAASAADAPLVWDLAGVMPGGWMQIAGYTNTVTVSTSPDRFRVTGAVVLEDGILRTLVDSRVRDLLIGADGVLDLANCAMDIRSPYRAYDPDCVLNGGTLVATEEGPNWTSLRWRGRGVVILLR